MLLDMSMPEMGGKELLTVIRNAGISVPVAVCSGYSEAEFCTGLRVATSGHSFRSRSGRQTLRLGWEKPWSRPDVLEGRPAGSNFTAVFNPRRKRFGDRQERKRASGSGGHSSMNTVDLDVGLTLPGETGLYHFNGLNDDIDYTLRAHYRDYWSERKTLSKFNSFKAPRSESDDSHRVAAGSI